MKKFILATSCLFMLILNIYGQQSPETALYFNSWYYGGTNAVLTDSSFGPPTTGINYGALGNSYRYAWTYIPVCDTNLPEVSLSPWVDTLGFAIYGPFEDTTQIISKLQSSNPINSYLSTWGMGPSNLFPYNHPKGIYYIAFRAGYFTGSFTVRAQLQPLYQFNFCSLCKNPFDIQQKICLVTLDSSTQRNQLIWDLGDTNNLSGFYFARENNIAGQFDSLTFIPKDSATTFIDMTANPAVRNYKYLMYRVDSCGYYFDQSFLGTGYRFIVNTLHLQQGIITNNSINLTWNSNNNAPYPGAGPFVQSYFIYRSNGTGPFVCIDSIPISSSSYTDISPNQGLNLYQVAMRSVNSCSITRSNYQESKSNTISTTFTGMEDPLRYPFFSITPNPASKMFTLDLSHGTGFWNFRIFNLSGQLVLSRDNNHLNSLDVNCEKLDKGLYTVEVSQLGKSYYNKLIIN